jgi:uncharacterized protein (DUF302 family)
MEVATMNDSLRYWRTGAVAVVMAALGQGAGAGRGGGDERMQARRQSPYNVVDTVLRIEGSARQHGMAVFARSLRGQASRVIVLESPQGGTPVLMRADAPDRMELPLSLVVRLAGDGRTEVLSGIARDWQAMPQALALDLAELNAVVGEALAAR